MKLLFISLCLVVAALGEDKYDSSLDSIDVSEVIGNERLLKSYIKCLLDKGPCTAELRKVKDKLTEALATRCVKCTEKQKEVGKQLSKEIKKTHPDLWKQLATKYDPDGKYQETFQDYLKA